MDKIFTMAQLKELLDIHEKTIIEAFANRIENLQSCKENKQLKCEVKSLQESTEFQNETYEKMKNDMKEEKQKLEADYRNT